MAMTGSTRVNVEAQDFIWADEEEVDLLELVGVGTNFL